MVNNETSKISCIIPTRNRADLLIRAIDSVLNQTYSNLELIIVDNASIDNTPSVIAGYCAKDQRVRQFVFDNQANASATRNYAFTQATGKYVAFLDDDDAWEPSKLEKQLQYVDSYTIVGCRYWTIRSRLMRLSLIKQRIENVRYGFSNPFRLVNIDDLLRDNCGLSPSTMLLRSELFAEIGGFDEEFVGPEGRDLFLRLVQRFGQALVLNERLSTRYEEHGSGNNISSRPILIESSWKDFKKQQHLMNPKAKRHRLIQIYFYETLYSDQGIQARRQALWNAMKQFRLLELRYQFPLYAQFLLFNGHIFFQKGHLR